MERLGIKTDIEIGQQIFQNIPNDLIPEWAGLVLSRFDNHVEYIPSEVKEIFEIISNKQLWREAHNQFTKIRQFLLKYKNYKPESYLLLAEIVAKVTYNSSGLPAPFDNDNGWYIASLAMGTATFFHDERLQVEVESALLIFERNKTFKENIEAAKDFLLYKKIDDILWFDWDPIGINDNAPRDEYQSYVLPVFELKKSGAGKQEIAQYLLKFEKERMGIVGSLEKCLFVAEKVIKAS